MAAIRPRDAQGWGHLQERLGGAEYETPMTFLYRHMRAAYVGRSGARYCHEDCLHLEPCPVHG